MTKPNPLNENIAFANEYMPAIVEILKANAGLLLKIEIASPDKDMQEATDLVITVQGGDVAVRVRRPGYHKRYGDFTIRAYNNDHRTEIHKIRDGFARWYLYAWAKGGKLKDWILVDLDGLRESGLLNNPKIIMNKDGLTGFCKFSTATLQLNQCLVATADSSDYL